MVSAQAERAVATADLVLFVVDGRTGATETDLVVARTLRRSGRPVVLAVTKVDDERAEPDAAELWSLGLGEPYPVSGLHGRGSGDLLDAVLDALPTAPVDTPTRSGGPRRVALVGRPNVGKSSLLNRLTGERTRGGRRGRPAPRSTRSTAWSSSAARSGGSSTRPGCAGGSARPAGWSTTPACAPPPRSRRPRSPSCCSTPREPLTEQDQRVHRRGGRRRPGPGARVQQVGSARRGPPRAARARDRLATWAGWRGRRGSTCRRAPAGRSSKLAEHAAGEPRVLGPAASRPAG